jgi:DegV family protein with EDD domain
MANVAIVTDTSSDLTPDVAEAAGVRLVPLTVSFGDETWEAGTELTNEVFYQKLTAPGAPFPRTAAPNPAAFEAAYREALDAGAHAVVCITISDKLSATYSSAVQGASAFDEGVVQVVDSASTTHSLGMVVDEAAKQAASGATQAEIVARARDLVLRSDLVFVASTLEFLQKGGRIGRAQAMVGTVLSIKPILRVEDGAVAGADRKRTNAKARARMLELVTLRPVERATVVHTGGVDTDALRADFAAAAKLDASDVAVGLVGPVAGSHVGPGMYGVSTIATA